jgi:outer membrane immunogenic protein
MKSGFVSVKVTTLGLALALITTPALADQPAAPAAAPAPAAAAPQVAANTTPAQTAPVKKTVHKHHKKKAVATPAAAPMEAPVPMSTDWRGAYVAADVGGTWGDLYDGPHGRGGNASGGVQGGYNWQYGDIVYGAEADITGMNVPGTAGAGNTFSEDWRMTFRGRVGYAVDRYLPYLTAGLGLTSTSFSSATSSTSTVRPGFVLGTGVDVKLCDHFFARGEYLYSNVPAQSVTTGTAAFKGGVNDHTLAIGVGYRF